jgi:hypothetical protein
LAEFGEIEGDDDFFPLGTVPGDWFENRSLGAARVLGLYADIYSVEWVAFLRRKLAAECLRLGIEDIDSGVLQRGSPRRLTQLASLEVYKQDLSGIYYRSRYGHNLDNWALFESLNAVPQPAKSASPNDPMIEEAFRILGIRLE